MFKKQCQVFSDWLTPHENAADCRTYWTIVFKSPAGLTIGLGSNSPAL